MPTRTVEPTDDPTLYIFLSGQDEAMLALHAVDDLRITEGIELNSDPTSGGSKTERSGKLPKRWSFTVACFDKTIVGFTGNNVLHQGKLTLAGQYATLRGLIDRDVMVTSAKHQNIIRGVVQSVEVQDDLKYDNYFPVTVTVEEVFDRDIDISAILEQGEILTPSVSVGSDSGWELVRQETPVGKESDLVLLAKNTIPYSGALQCVRQAPTVFSAEAFFDKYISPIFFPSPWLSKEVTKFAEESVDNINRTIFYDPFIDIRHWRSFFNTSLSEKLLKEMAFIVASMIITGELKEGVDYRSTTEHGKRVTLIRQTVFETIIATKFQNLDKFEECYSHVQKLITLRPVGDAARTLVEGL